jgi:bis(5'-nucleosidyl)-tetraphosphatase
MTYEKSCGAIIFRRENGIKYLIIFNKKGKAAGHWGFPKGHVENNETELETAAREISEETGLHPCFTDGFRVVSRYSPKRGITKDAVYFLAESTYEPVKIQKSELAGYRWCSFDEACKLLKYDKKYLEEADRFIRHI